MIERISKDQYYLDIAFAVCKRSNCIKRHYGAVIVKNDEIIVTGYNGSPRGEANCCDVGVCNRIDVPMNTNYEGCHSVHAEQNAIISASREKLIGSTLYLAGEEIDMATYGKPNVKYNRMPTCTPCPLCERMIANSGIVRIVSGGV